MNKHIYTVYAKQDDMTFIMEEHDEGIGPVSIECVGWYFGEPDEDATESFIGKLKAEY